MIKGILEEADCLVAYGSGGQSAKRVYLKLMEEHDWLRDHTKKYLIINTLISRWDLGDLYEEGVKAPLLTEQEILSYLPDIESAKFRRGTVFCALLKKEGEELVYLFFLPKVVLEEYTKL